MNTRGSEWRKWDLHVHTPASLCSEYGGDNDEIWEQFIQRIENLPSDIKVLGINDYLFLDGYEKVLKYKKDGRIPNIELLLPVIEFRLKEFVGSKELGRINYHIIFADESLLSPQDIQYHFLQGLRSKANLSADIPNGCTWGGIITRDTLIDLGKHISASIPLSCFTGVQFIPSADELVLPYLSPTTANFPLPNIILFQQSSIVSLIHLYDSTLKSFVKTAI